MEDLDVSQVPRGLTIIETDKGKFVVCPKCNGDGMERQVIKRNAQGRRRRNVRKCPVCNGARRMPLKAFLEHRA